MATLVLTVVGTVLGGPIGGAIGALAGQVVDNAILFKPKGREGPRLSDLRLQTSRYGDQIPKLFGTMRVAGSVIWATDLIEHRDSQGGGKGQPKVTTYSYSASFAVALSARRVSSVQRIWADGNLLRGSAGDFKTGLGAFRLYSGSEDQALDPLIAADKGLALTTAHRGIAYAVFEDLQLADFGNRIPSLTFEVVADASSVSVGTMARDISGGAVVPDGASSDPVLAGYAASGATMADALAPLIDAFDLAVRSDGTGMRLQGDAAIEASIVADMIGGAFNGKPERGMRYARGKAEDVPIRLSTRHYDSARDYQAGVQTARREGAGRKEVTVDLPAVMSATEARALSEAQLQSLWTGRNGLDLRCDWRALTLAPGAYVGVAGQAGRWRIDKAEWEGIGVRLTVRQKGGAGVALPPASSGAALAQADVPHGPTSLVVADLPVPGDELPTAPLVVAAAAGAQAGWRSAELFVEDPGTAALTSLGRTAPPATVGVAVSLPDTCVFPDCFDTISTVDVHLLNNGMALAGASDAALLSGANRALLGREVIQFGSAVQTGPADWRLSRLLRGRRGTEWAMATHSVGENFLMLDDNSLAAIPSSWVPLGATVQLNAIGIGDLTPAMANETVLGQAILPLAPVHVSAAFDGSEWRFDWVRRSRLGWSWNDGSDAPLGEEQELYRINLIHSGSIFRTVETGSSHWVMDAAIIATDNAAGVSGAATAEIRQIGTFGAGRPATIGFAL